MIIRKLLKFFAKKNLRKIFTKNEQNLRHLKEQKICEDTCDTNYIECVKNCDIDEGTCEKCADTREFCYTGSVLYA